MKQFSIFNHHSSIFNHQSSIFNHHSSIIITFLAILSLTSCRSTKPVPQIVVVHDSIRTEVHTVTVTLHDTIAAPLPKDSIAIVTPDTSSRLETSVAVSEAGIRDGLLWHSIWNKASVDVAVDHKETVRDSIVYREKEVPVPVPVEVEVEKPLTWWQQLRLWLGTAALILLALAAAYGLFRLWKKIRPPNP
jgi:hypothetical protein